MKPFFWLSLLFLLLWLMAMSYLHSTMCNCGSIGTTTSTAVPITDKPTLRSISISDVDKNYSSFLYDNLLFPQSNCMYESPISDSLNTVFQSLANHLQTNTDRILLLSGMYQSAETNNCTSDNLGLARAESVRQLLVDKGAPIDQIRLGSNEQNILDIADGKIMGGITYSFIDGDLTAVEQRLRARNITLYFESSQNDIFLDIEQVKYFDDLKYFLSHNKDAKALVTGHTDDEGSAANNRRLSRKRAEFIRSFMIEKGINADQIFSKGMGPDEPIASNDTAEGKAKNRRVEITIQ